MKTAKILARYIFGAHWDCEWEAEPMSVDFLCDMFGHPSQMPRIFTGIGYRDCRLERGMNARATPPFFEWEAPDGTRLFTFKLRDAQGDGAFARPRSVLEGELQEPAARRIVTARVHFGRRGRA